MMNMKGLFMTLQWPRFPDRLQCHVLTSVVMLWLAIGGLGGGAAAGQAQQPSLSPDDYINQRCTFCHSRILAIVFLKRRVENHGMADVDAFLARHHMPDAGPREVLVHYLESIAK